MRLKKIGFHVLSVVLILSACSSQSSNKNESKKQTECTVLIPEFFDSQCSELTFPADWDDPSGEETIKIAAVVLTTENTPKDAVPVVYLEGGPGGDALGVIQFFGKSSWQFQLAEKHPLVYFSQRGATGSSNELKCQAIDDFFLETLGQKLTKQQIDAKYLQEMQSCVAELKDDDIDFTDFSSQASANDVEALRQALYGEEPWHIIGVSYGARLGQSLMRQHPDGLVSVLLDSVDPSDPTKGIVDAAASADQALSEVFTTCQEDDVCNKKFPDLENRFYAVLEAADETPITFTIQNFDGEKTVDRTVIVDGDDIMGIVFQSLYRSESAAAIPQLVQDLENGETRFLEQSVFLEIQNQAFFSPIMYESILCHDVYSFLQEKNFEEGKSGNDKLDSYFSSEDDFEMSQKVCDILGTGAADESDIEKLESDIPTLLYGGQYDPITPLAHAESVAEGLQNSQVVAFPHTGHSALSQECGVQIAVQFFTNPQKVDTSCTEEIDRLYWVPDPIEADLAFEPFEKGFLEGQLSEHTLKGVAPADWEEVSPGYFMQDRTNAISQATLLQLAYPKLEERTVADFLPGLGLKDLVSVGVIQSEGRTWEVVEATSAQDQNALVYTTSKGQAVASVVLLYDPEDEEALKSIVVPEVLAHVELTEG